MLHPEKAREQLQAFQTTTVEKRRLSAIGKLSAKLATSAHAFLGRNPSGKALPWNKRETALNRAMEILDEASPREREKFFVAFFPKLATALEATWQLFHTLPYQIGYARKAFRAPHDSEVTRFRRQIWLNSLIDQLAPYDPDVIDVSWLASWSPYLGYGGADQMGYLFAAVIDAGGVEGEEVYEILKASAKGEHEIGAMGRHVSRALMVCSKPEAWDFMERMLLAAQRQEGLRQAILESIDECHPQAFRRMIRLILDQNLVRFSSVVRAVDVWLHLGWDSATPKVITDTLEKLSSYLNNDASRQEALKKSDGESVFLALWSLAYDDARKAVEPARALLQDKGLERRFGAITLLSRLQHPAATMVLREAVEDEDLRIALTAFDALAGDNDTGRFERTERLLARMPMKPQALKTLIWPWAQVVADPKRVADRLVDSLDHRPLKTLYPYLPRMSSYGRYQVAQRLSKLKNWDAQTRSLMFDLVNDRDPSVRRIAMESLKKAKITPEEAEKVELAMSRKSGDVRAGVLAMLLKQPVALARASAERLLAAKNGNQRLGGLEMLRQLIEKNLQVSDCRERARQYQIEHPEQSDEEEEQLEVIFDVERKVHTLDDALGLLDPSKLTAVEVPVSHPVRFITEAAVECLKELDQLIDEHRTETITIGEGAEQRQELLGNSGFPEVDWRKSPEENGKRLPLREVWDEWFANRPKKMRDPDGCELLRASIWIDAGGYDWEEWQKLNKRPPLKKAFATLTGNLKPVRLKYHHQVRQLLYWLHHLHANPGGRDWLLDATETAFSLVPEKELKRPPNKNTWQDDWREWTPFTVWLQHTGAHWHGEWTPQQRLRNWKLQHWRDRPVPGVKRYRPFLDELRHAYRLGVVTQDDFLDDLLGPRSDVGTGGNWFNTLVECTSRRSDVLKEHPELKPLIERCRERILDIELKRGDTPTAATQPARCIRSLTGIDTLIRLLLRLSRRGFRRSGGEGKLEILTHLVSVTFPAEDDTTSLFAEKIEAALALGRFPKDRLIELAFIAPQWASRVETYLEWPGFAEGVWWWFEHLHAEPEQLNADDKVEEEENDRPKPSTWQRMLSERTPLSEEDRRDGAVDVDWFRRVYDPLGKRRWLALAAAAHHAASRGAAKKAAYLAQVLLGKAKKRDLVSGIRQRNLRENVRLLGLLPLARGDNREKDLLLRYRVLQGYRRYAKSLGPMSKEGALRTAAIGLENLARTAGYADPIRLEWSMEAKEIADLAQGPIARTVEGVTVTLTLNEQAQAEVTVQRGDKVLKSVPPKVRKDRTIASLMDRKTDLRRQASRIRESLETAACRGDAFSGAELRQLFEHPMLVPMLSRLVLIGESDFGYPIKGGKALRHHSGKTVAIKQNEILKIAHPYDLWTSLEWPDWQKECFAFERVQPFKQVFRELYILTDQERKDGTTSHRYAGQQVNPTQAQALFGSRGWGTREGVEKTFHQLGLTAEVSFRYGGFTPLEVEGWTLEGVSFRKRGQWDRVPLKDVPASVFSEVMRDLDLVVSVAHRGGVDPEASASTVEMRAALLRETCSLLKIDNLNIKANHVLIDGQLANYTIHLGSAVVHRQPGGHLCLVPVHAQHRGRLFLPFADDDPRTAEVISKSLMLARDHEILDPTILDQIRA